MVNRNTLNQFASRLIGFSSQYSDTNWKAQNVLGAPASGGVYGDNVGAWCPSTSDQNQYLEVGFETPVFVSAVRVYENYHGGAVTQIEALNGENNYVSLWSAPSPITITQYNVFQPAFPVTIFKSSQLRLTITQAPRNLFSEIEAVELVGSLLEIGTPAKTIEADVASLFESKLFADLEIVVAEGPSVPTTIQAHRNIVAARAPLLFELIERRNRVLNDVKAGHLQLVLEFVYSDELNETLLRRIIDEEKRESEARAPAPSRQNSFEPAIRDEDAAGDDLARQPGSEWLLTINNVARLASLFKLKRLESLLVNYLANSFLSIDNVFHILIDSRAAGKKPSESTSTATTGESESLKLDDKFPVATIEEVCLEYTRINLKDASKHPLFGQLPRDVIIDIIRNLF